MRAATILWAGSVSLCIASVLVCSTSVGHERYYRFTWADAFWFGFLPAAVAVGWVDLVLLAVARCWQGDRRVGAAVLAAVLAGAWVSYQLVSGQMVSDDVMFYLRGKRHCY